MQVDTGTQRNEGETQHMDDKKREGEKLKVAERMPSRAGFI